MNKIENHEKINLNKKLLSTTGLLVALVLLLSINILSNSLFTSLRLDLTENKLFTLSSGTKNIISSLDEPIKLKFYFSQDLFNGIPALLNYGSRIRDMLEEYAADSDGKIQLTVIDPEPFSEAEDQAVGYGIQQLPISATGETGYLGLVGTNSTDDEQSIPFFKPDKEDSLEYEVSKLIHNLAHPKKRVIGIISSLPMFGKAPAGQTMGRPSSAWTITKLLQESFELRDLGTEVGNIDKEIDTLMIVHPKNLSDTTRYTIDQFVIKGGKAMVFVDPFAEEDQSSPNPNNPMAIPETTSKLPDLFEKWGITYTDNKVAGDLENAIRVTFPSARGPQEIEYLPWLQLSKAQFNAKDFITNELNTINLASSGSLDKVEKSDIQFTPLISTGAHANTLDKDAIMFVRDPANLIENFKPGTKSLVLAARISGKVKTAFPNGKPKKTEADKTDPGFVAESKDNINVIIVADTDILADKFWVQVQNFLGMSVPTPIADNAKFITNAIDNLGGNNDLISLRSRGYFSRPFTRVETIRREAEIKFRDKERSLQAKLEETEQKLSELQKKKSDNNSMLLSPDQKKELDNFRNEQVKTRKALRSVQHDLQKNIEKLGYFLKFINIGLMPILIGLFVLGINLSKYFKRTPVTNH